MYSNLVALNLFNIRKGSDLKPDANPSGFFLNHLLVEAKSMWVD